MNRTSGKFNGALREGRGSKFSSEIGLLRRQLLDLEDKILKDGTLRATSVLV